MGNGFTVEQMLSRIETHLYRLEEKMDLASKDIAHVNSQGCAHRQDDLMRAAAHRTDDLRRIDELESWRTRGIVGVIGLAIGLVVEFILGATNK